MSISRASRIISLLLERRIEPMYWGKFGSSLNNFVIRYVNFLHSYGDKFSEEAYTISQTKVEFDQATGIMTVQVLRPGLVWKDLSDQLIKLAISSGWWLLEPVKNNNTPWRSLDHPPSTILRFSPNPHPGSDRMVTRVPDRLFHAAPNHVVDAIMRRGILLFPAGNERYFGGGQFQVAYVASSPQVAIQVLLTKGYSRENISVFVVHTNDLNSHTKFFYDPQFANSFYTNSPIPAHAIELM